MWNEFKKFAIQGNALDLAIGVIIGAAFGKIVSSLVDDVLMPPLGMIIGRVDFSNLFLTLNGQHYDSLPAAKSAGAPTLNYGVFLNNIISFLIVAFAVFILVQQINRLRAPAAKAAEAAASPEPSEEVKLLTQIRDLLRMRA